MRNKKIKTNSGFMALMSTIIICAVLLLIASNVSFNGFYSSSNIFDSEFKDKSMALAEACVDIAILNLSSGTTYNPTNEIVNVNADTCTIESITADASSKTIYAEANPNNYFTHLKIIVGSTDFSIISWQEI